ncbi:hypothetical protein LOC71_13895 [Rhodopirellula sp. JC740]|uniref:Uncharacterized protein n=1 Tax=Rhodopirellula halodulae TaxID=2894198 RepID=A0ABS8NK83_9BACT|nr:hypothetical protein [Rhodopirellula sp. JC740]MCC9643372.1 hypothetical protein [Rhodopirellula sp. JC740]
MCFRLVASLNLTLSLAIGVNAATWTSSDGFLSVTPPDSNGFQMVPSAPPPFICMWISNDETMHFGVMKMDVPPTIQLNQSSAEQGLAEEIGGRTTRLETTQVGGHEVWNMRGQAELIDITQALVRNDDELYKVMAATVGAKADQQIVQRFIGSIAIGASHTAKPRSSSTDESPNAEANTSLPSQERVGSWDLHSFSKKIGGAGALLGIGLLVYLNSRKKKTTVAQPRP